MKISTEWLKEFIQGELPETEKLCELLTFHSFEVEGSEQIGDDTVLDIDILPNRAHDCLSYRGIAKEVSILTGLTLVRDSLTANIPEWKPSGSLSVDVEDTKRASRYSALVVEGVKVAPSPDWLKRRLETIGQRSINNIVDATNYVMFSIGQPLHAFDMDKLSKKEGKYAISVRTAQKGEKIEALDGTEYALSEEDLLIVDGNARAPIGIAGVKGGKQAEVSTETSRIIIEAANFDSIGVRKTSQALKLRTEASVRFENSITPELTLPALRDVYDLIQKISGGSIEGYIDVNTQEFSPCVVMVSVTAVNKLLGTEMNVTDVEDILTRFKFLYKKLKDDSFEVTIPPERLDLRIEEDLVEEIGRIYGYRGIKAAQLPEPKESPYINKRYAYMEKIRAHLLSNGFSEVYTYTFRLEGEVEVANPIASDKKFLRTDLSQGVYDSLTLNAKNASLLGLDEIRVFEIGTVFSAKGEHTSLAYGIFEVVPGNKKQESAQEKLRAVEEGISSLLGVKLAGKLTDSVIEYNLDSIIESLPESESYILPKEGNKKIKYKTISPYPFVLRDIALWVPESTSASVVEEAIREFSGDLLKTLRLFDSYRKEERVSYAFHLVFQSSDKTLSDDEVNTLFERITDGILGKNGWKIR